MIHRFSLTPLLLLLPVALSACSGSHYASRWNGQRGYDGSGDYGYDVDESRAEARTYRAHAIRNYPPPGPAEDPWGPYIHEAASRFSIPERWIREVMRQESGGRLQAADGSLTTSWVGAMGLMQVMPQTYDGLRHRYALGDDPYEPHDNIMAGAAYIREMSDQFGAPGFLAAYNAGPERLNAYLAGNAELPAETVNYLGRVAPRLGTEVAMTGPLAVYASGGVSGGNDGALMMATTTNAPMDRAYAGGGMSGANYYSPERDTTAMAEASAVLSAPPPQPVEVASTPLPPPPSHRPSGRYVLPLIARAEAAEPLPQITPASALVPLAAPGSAPSGWGVQVGAFRDPQQSESATQSARSMMAGPLSGTHSVVVPVEQGGATLYRARLIGLSPDMATAACDRLNRRGMVCFTVPPGS